MQYTVLLDRGENVRKVETEEQSRFIFSVMESLHIPFEWEPDKEMTALDKINIKKLLAEYNITIIDDLDGNVKIYVGMDLIGEWHKPIYCLREDRSQLDPKKRLFLEMKCTFNSPLIENEEGTN